MSRNRLLLHVAFLNLFAFRTFDRRLASRWRRGLLQIRPSNLRRKLLARKFSVRTTPVQALSVSPSICLSVFVCLTPCLSHSLCLSLCLSVSLCLSFTNRIFSSFVKSPFAQKFPVAEIANVDLEEVDPGRTINGISVTG